MYGMRKSKESSEQSLINTIEGGTDTTVLQRHNHFMKSNVQG
jgi:hypothetical protein